MTEPQIFIARVEKLTQELRSMQEDISTLSHPSLTESEAAHRMEAMEDLKSALDHMRHALWGWMQSRSSQQEVADSIQALRMQRVTEMLRVIKPAVEQSHADSTPEVRSFFEEIQALAQGTMDRHSA